MGLGRIVGPVGLDVVDEEEESLTGHELGEKEKVPDFEGRNRRDAIWEITGHRLLMSIVAR